jgi:transcriptional regulator with XRE-family HTH domain
MRPNESDMIRRSACESPASLRKRIGRRARAARLAAGRTQAEVAAAGAISLPTLQRFEAGANVSLDVLARVAIVLNAERELSELFILPDARTIDEMLNRRALPQRGRRRS